MNAERAGQTSPAFCFSAIPTLSLPKGREPYGYKKPGPESMRIDVLSVCSGNVLELISLIQFVFIRENSWLNFY
jgi:hypothetical protein